MPRRRSASTVTNDSATESAYVTQVVASIALVTKADGAADGTCDATDFTLTDELMSNGAKDLVKGASTTFSGAKLSFNNKTVNQDACKGAAVTLAYAAS